MSFPCMNKEPTEWLNQVKPLLRSLVNVVRVENPTTFIANIKTEHILPIIDAFLTALPGPLDWQSRVLMLDKDDKHNEVERVIRKFIKNSLTILIRLIAPTDVSSDTAAVEKLFKVERYVKIMAICGNENAFALGTLVGNFLKSDEQTVINDFIQSEMYNYWSCDILCTIYNRASSTMVLDKDVSEWLVYWLLSVSKSVNALGKYVQNAPQLSLINWQSFVNGLTELLECVSVYINDDVLSSCRIWESRGGFRNLLELKNGVLNMCLTYFCAAIQMPYINHATRCEAICSLTRFPYALTLVSHCNNFDNMLDILSVYDPHHYDEFVADIPRLRNLFVAPLLTSSHSFNCLLSTADIPLKMTESRPPSSIKTGTVVYELVLAYFNYDEQGAVRALRTPSILPFFLRVLVEANPSVNGVRSLKAAKNVFPVLENQDDFDYKTFFDLNYLTSPYLDVLAKTVGDDKPLSKLQKLMRENSTIVDVDDETIVVDKISRRNLRYVRLPSFEKLFLKDFYKTIIIPATPEVKVVRQAGAGPIREEFLYEIPSSEDEEEGTAEENGTKKPIKVKPLNEPLQVDEQSTDDSNDEVDQWPPVKPQVMHSSNRGRGGGHRGSHNQPSESQSKRPPTDYTGGHNRQTKERNKNRKKQRGADRKARQQNFL